MKIKVPRGLKPPFKIKKYFDTDRWTVISSGEFGFWIEESRLYAEFIRDCLNAACGVKSKGKKK